MVENYYWNDWYLGWGWFLWYGLIILMFSSLGNWGYTYSAHRKSSLPKKEALDILNERYARGELDRDDYNQMKNDIYKERSVNVSKIGMSPQQTPVY